MLLLGFLPGLRAQSPATPDSAAIATGIDSAIYYLFDTLNATAAQRVLSPLLDLPKAQTWDTQYERMRYLQYLRWREAEQIDSAIAAGERA